MVPLGVLNDYAPYRGATNPWTHSLTPWVCTRCRTSSCGRPYTLLWISSVAIDALSLIQQSVVGAASCVHCGPAAVTVSVCLSVCPSVRKNSGVCGGGHTGWARKARPQTRDHNSVNFTGKFLGKFAVKWILKIPSHIFCVATLPCETLMSAKQAINDKLQGSVAAYLRCSDVVNNQIKKGLLLSLWVSFFKSVNIWHSYTILYWCMTWTMTLVSSAVQ